MYICISIHIYICKQLVVSGLLPPLSPLGFSFEVLETSFVALESIFKVLETIF
jgi:hypothetical protein